MAAGSHSSRRGTQGDAPINLTHGMDAAIKHYGPATGPFMEEVVW